VKADLRLVLLGAAIVGTLGSGARFVHVQKRALDGGRATMDELQKKLDALRADRRRLLHADGEPAALRALPWTTDAVTNRALVHAVLDQLLAAQGLHGAVLVHDPAADGSFPSMVEVQAVPVDLGIDDYAAYGQVVAFLESLRAYAFTVDGLCIGCNDLGERGRVRLQLRYLAPAAEPAVHPDGA